MKIIISIILMTQISSAHGAICKYLPSASIKDAQSLLESFKKSQDIAVVDKFCESCLDRSPKPIVIDSIEVYNHSVSGYAGLKLNGKTIDLAYLYLNGENLSFKYNCQTKYISRYL
jgi:hypothetical protein